MNFNAWGLDSSLCILKGCANILRRRPQRQSSSNSDKLYSCIFTLWDPALYVISCSLLRINPELRSSKMIMRINEKAFFVWYVCAKVDCNSASYKSARGETRITMKTVNLSCELITL